MKKNENMGLSRSYLFLKRRILSYCLLGAFLFMSAISAIGQQNNQTISLNVEDVTLLEALHAINRQSSNSVMFRTEDVRQETKKVTVNMQNASVLAVVRAILEGTRFTAADQGEVVVVSLRQDAQSESVRITGIVRDTKGEVLPGVTVQIKGTALGTATGTDGRFLMNIGRRSDMVLVFSFVGMKTKEVPYTNQEFVEVTLEEDIEQIGEVVITGYMNIAKGLNTGSTYTLKAEDIMNAGESNIDQMLQGVVPGMSVQLTSGQVGATPKIRIRGTSTLLGNQEPVWVVDGIIQRDPLPISDQEASLAGDANDLREIAANSISWLNPYDIETITVLKDASATAIYGSKAANGVIVVTTKRGTSGRLSVSYNGDYTIGQRPRYGLYDLMNSQELMNFQREFYEDRDRYPSEILNIGYAGLIKQLHNKEIDQAEFARRYAEMESMNTDWFKILFRNSFNHNHNISITGGSDKFTNRTSIGIVEEKGEAKGNDKSFFSLNSNTQVNFLDNLSLGISVNGSIRNVDGFAYGVSPFEYAYNTARILPVYNEDGEYFYHEKYYTPSSTVISNKNYYNYNIINERDNTSNNQVTKIFNTNINLNWKFLPYLEYQGLLSYGYSVSDIKSYATEYSYYITGIRGYEFGTITPNSDEEKKSKLPNGGLLQSENASNTSYTFRNAIVFSKTFNEAHTVSAQLGIELVSNKMKGAKYTRYGYLHYRGEKFAQIPNTYIPYGSVEINPLYKEELDNTKITNNESNYLSEYLTLIYSYDNRYVMNFNARLDASNRFGQDHSKKFQPTWSIGAKWRVGNEIFTQNWNWMNALDIYGSYGYQGNAVESVSPYLIATDNGYSQYTNQYSLRIKSLPYYDLGWEKTKTWNFGVDLSILNGRLNFVGNLYKKTSDVLSAREVPFESGVKNAVIFGFEMENKGYDFVVNIVPVQTENFRWQFSVNSGVARNKLKKNDKINSLNEYLDGSAIVNGASYRTFYSYKYSGLNPEDGTPNFENLDIETTDNPLDFLVKSGKFEPDFSGGFSTLLRYKKFTLNAMFAMSFGAQGRLPELYKTTYGGNGIPGPEQNVSRKLADRWRKPGDENYTDIPSVPKPGSISISLPLFASASATRYQMYSNSDIRVANTDLIRCRQISLGYEFGEELLKSLYIKRLSIRASMSNPFMIVFDKKWKGIDPETGNWPARRTTSLSLNVSF